MRFFGKTKPERKLTKEEAREKFEYHLLCSLLLLGHGGHEKWLKKAEGLLGPEECEKRREEYAGTWKGEPGGYCYA